MKKRRVMSNKARSYCSEMLIKLNVLREVSNHSNEHVAHVLHLASRKGTSGGKREIARTPTIANVKLLVWPFVSAASVNRKAPLPFPI